MTALKALDLCDLLNCTKGDILLEMMTDLLFECVSVEPWP